MKKTPPAVNIQWIARKARVSKSSVSRFLNGGYTSEGVKKKLQRIIKESGFKPSVHAQNLSKGRAGCFGVLTHTIENPWFAQILVGIEAECHRQQVSILVGSMGEETSLKRDFADEWIRSKRVDGFILTNPGDSAGTLVRKISKAGLKLVLLGVDRPYRAGQIINSDNREAGKKAGQHLVGLGHRRFAFVGGDKGYLDSEERLAGLREALKQGGLSREPGTLIYTGWKPQEAANFARQWAKGDRRKAPTAVVFANDLMALSFLRQIHQLGFKIPGDVSITGMDDIYYSALTYPALTTIKQDMVSIGAACIRSLVEQMKNPEQKKWPAVLFPVELVVRESTSSPRG